MTLKRTNTASDDEILFWHKQILAWRGTTLEKSKFCAKEQLCSTRFSWFITRLFYKQFSDHDAHIRETEIATSYIESKLVMRKFAKKHHLNYYMLQQAFLHLQYLSRLSDLLDKTPVDYVIPVPQKGVFTKEQLEMQSKPTEFNIAKAVEFIQVPQRLPKPEPEPGITKAKNTIELMAAGIRMTIDHGIGQEKLIKIIEFLEDL